MLIGKTAYCLLRHSVQRCVESRRWVCAHARNHAICQIKVALKCLIAAVLVDVAYSRFCGHCQQHFTAHAQQRLFRNFRLKFRRLGDVFRWFFCILYAECHSIPRPRFPYKVRNFDDLETFPLIFAFFVSWKFAVFLLPVYFTYCVNFEVDMATHCRVIAFLLLILCVTLWPWLLTFWPWPALIYGGSLDQHCQTVRRSYAYPFLSYEL